MTECFKRIVFKGYLSVQNNEICSIYNNAKCLKAENPYLFQHNPVNCKLVCHINDVSFNQYASSFSVCVSQLFCIVQ